MGQGTRRLTAATIILVLCSGCTGGPARPDAQRAARASSSAAPSVSTPAMDHQDAAAAADVRLTLERLLGHHAMLMIRLMRGPIDKEPTFVAAAQQALDRNTDELVSAVAQVYGTQAGNEFR